MLACSLSQAKNYRAANADQLKSMTGQLLAGDSLAVAPGNYDISTLSISGLKGAADKWIVIRGETGAVIRGASDCCNLIQIDKSSYVKLMGLELTLKDHNNGIDGINVSGGYSHHIRFEGLNIHHMTGNGISLFPDSAAFIELVKSEIANIEGSGLYWGYPGRNIVHDCLIEGNYIHHCPMDPNAETNYGIQFKGWGYRTRIVNNVLHDVGGTTRSGLIVYYGKKPLAGDSPDDVNVVAGNAVWNARSEGITVMSDALVENNIVFDAGTGINLQTYGDESFSGTSVVENLRVRNNTVFRCRGACFGISGWGSVGATVSFTGNAAYQAAAGNTAISGSPGKAECLGNAVFGQGSPANSIKGAGLGDFLAVGASTLVPALDFFPAPASPLRDAVPAASCPADDFNGQPRPQGKACDAGAYEAGEAGASVNTGWMIKQGFKAGSASGTGLKAPAPKSRPDGNRKRFRRSSILLTPENRPGEPITADGRIAPHPQSPPINLSLNRH